MKKLIDNSGWNAANDFSVEIQWISSFHWLFSNDFCWAKLLGFVFFQFRISWIWFVVFLCEIFFSLRSFLCFCFVFGFFVCVIKIQIGLILLVNSPVSWFLRGLIVILLLGDDSFAAIYLLCVFYMHSANLMYDFVSFSSLVVALLLLLLFLFLSHTLYSFYLSLSHSWFDFR